MSTSRIDLVINTGPLIALAAGISQPEVVLRHYRRVLVPREVAQEIRAGGIEAYGGNILDYGGPIEISESDVNVRRDLVLALDRGEAIDISSTSNMMRANGIGLSEQLERQAIKFIEPNGRRLYRHG